ncbi:MAG: Cytochrome P450-like protein [Thermoleophilia bacterium]|nr:Cytochrome P450-like protein [Thermoleophilia bacterium]
MSCPIDHGGAAAIADAAALHFPDVRPGDPRAKRNEHRLFRASQRLMWYFNMYARWRGKRGADVVKIPFLGYGINGAVAVREMLLDEARFPNTNSKPDTVLLSQVVGPESLTNQNGEPHKVLRRKLVDLFTPKYVRELCDRVLTPVMDDLEARLRAGETVDMAHFTKVMTGSIVADLNGETFSSVAEQSARAYELSELGRTLANMIPARLRAFTPKELKLVNERLDLLIEGLEETYEAGDEATVPGRFKARDVPWDVARGILVVLILGGLETTQSGGSRIVALLSDTNQWGPLRANPGAIMDTIDESIRVTTPVPIITRWVGEDTVFRGAKMKKDKLVVAFLNNAVRDQRVVPDGGDFCPAREIPRELRQLHFGAGPHFCIGNNLAREEMRMLMERILAVPGELEVVDRTYAKQVLIPTYKHLMVRVRPVATAPASAA